MKYDDIIGKHLGQFGKYQFAQMCLFGFPLMFTSIHPLSWTFTGAKIKHRCVYPGELNDPAASVLNRSWPDQIPNGFPNVDASCMRYSNSVIPDGISWNVSTFSVETCIDGYAWDREGSVMSESATSRWSLVCDRAIIRAFIQSVSFIGQLFGSGILGLASDHLGRKPVFICSLLAQGLCGVATAFVPNWGLFALFRFGIGFALPGILNTVAVVSAELAGPRYRLMVCLVNVSFFALGIAVLGALTYLIRDYQYLQLAISIPELALVVYWWLVPESARWLASRGRYDEATKILQQAAKINGRPALPSDWYSKLDAEPEQMPVKDALLSLIRTPNLRKRTLLHCLLQFVVNMAYYGLAANPTFLFGDDRLAFIVGGFLETSGIIIVGLTLNFLGRIFMTSSYFLLAGACLFVTLLIPTKAAMAYLILVLVGKGMLTSVLSLTRLLTSEHYPTPIRNTALGSIGSVARLGAVVASFFSMYLADKEPVTVAVIYATSLVVAGVATLFLPETTGSPLLQSLAEAEAFGTDQPFFLFGFQTSKRLLSAKKQKVYNTVGDDPRVKNTPVEPEVDKTASELNRQEVIENRESSV